MNQHEKDSLLTQAKTNIQKVRGNIEHKLSETVESIKAIKDKLYKLPPSEVFVQDSLLSNFKKRTTELQSLYPSPYFIKCEILFDGESLSRIFYFSKFSFPEEHIYSWVSPAAAIRFEKPGKFSYPIPDFQNKTGKLINKEQYMVSEGKIIFMAVESLSQPRELVYQEYFSQRKSSFMLPEIVEQMERAQDMVIRANPLGSFLISGPAGSGKTTLALHRVAYLVQSPDTAEKFKESEIIVFVQDSGTQAYFGGLLPQLGIHNVTIATFADWARQQLKLLDFRFAVRIGGLEQEKDFYEYQKHQALKNSPQVKYNINIFETLSKVYGSYFSEASHFLFDQQKVQNTLDRFDLTLLMQAYIHTFNGLFQEDTEFKQLKGGKVQRKKILTPIQYSLMVVDEAQNYLPEQIQVLRNCINNKYHAIVYVGDLAQQTQLCTLKDWQQVGEDFGEGRKAVLQKNYRSTRQILEYINSIGFITPIPEGVKVGKPVQEFFCKIKAKEIEYVKKIAAANPTTVVGVICKSKEYLQDFILEQQNVHLLTINEAQGVEFDVLCLVGINKELFQIEDNYTPALAEERKRVNKDLLYVALTRAMNELHVLGESKIQDII